MTAANVRTIRFTDEPRPFTVADKALIKRVHGYMPAQQLLEVLNERLVADFGPDEEPHTMEQLYAEIGEVDAPPADAHDWSSLRKLVARARRDGVLDKVTRQLIDDFAVVFSLNGRQVLQLHDVLLKAKEDE
jgi:hypothetical protein